MYTPRAWPRTTCSRSWAAAQSSVRWRTGKTPRWSGGRWSTRSTCRSGCVRRTSAAAQPPRGVDLVRGDLEDHPALRADGVGVLVAVVPERELVDVLPGRLAADRLDHVPADLGPVVVVVAADQHVMRGSRATFRAFCRCGSVLTRTCSPS